VTAKPSGVLIVTVRPWVGSQPANEITPPAGAGTSAPEAPPTSMPVWPCSWYSSPPNENPRSTGPSAGQVHAPAGVGATSVTANSSISRVVACFVNIAGERT
jgi:hypothetical protein